VSTHYHRNALKPFGAHYTTAFDASQEKYFLYFNLKKVLDLAGLALYNYMYKEEKEMEKAKETKVARPTKKGLINEIIALGIATDVAQSLSRANIEALELVKELIIARG